MFSTGERESKPEFNENGISPNIERKSVEHQTEQKRVLPSNRPNNLPAISTRNLLEAYE